MNAILDWLMGLWDNVLQPPPAPHIAVVLSLMNQTEEWHVDWPDYLVHKSGLTVISGWEPWDTHVRSPASGTVSITRCDRKRVFAAAKELRAAIFQRQEMKANAQVFALGRDA